MGLEVWITQKELRVFPALRELHYGIGMGWNGMNGEWPMENMRNGSQGFDDVFLWMFLLLSGRACFLTSVVAFRFRLPVVDRGTVMACLSLSGKAGHGVACSVFCIRKNLKGDVSTCPLSLKIFGGYHCASHWIRARFLTGISEFV
jgi:hypothetical protein